MTSNMTNKDQIDANSGSVYTTDTVSNVELDKKYVEFLDFFEDLSPKYVEVAKRNGEAIITSKKPEGENTGNMPLDGIVPRYWGGLIKHFLYGLTTLVSVFQYLYYDMQTNSIYYEVSKKYADLEGSENDESDIVGTGIEVIGTILTKIVEELNSNSYRFLMTSFPKKDMEAGSPLERCFLTPYSWSRFILENDLICVSTDGENIYLVVDEESGKTKIDKIFNLAKYTKQYSNPALACVSFRDRVSATFCELYPEMDYEITAGRGGIPYISYNEIDSNQIMNNVFMHAVEVIEDFDFSTAVRYESSANVLVSLADVYFGFCYSLPREFSEEEKVEKKACQRALNNTMKEELYSRFSGGYINQLSFIFKETGWTEQEREVVKLIVDSIDKDEIFSRKNPKGLILKIVRRIENELSFKPKHLKKYLWFEVGKEELEKENVVGPVASNPAAKAVGGKHGKGGKGSKGGSKGVEPW
ncbi:hypothetical protein DIPPA_58088 [Diplonema papillatum]|nr:hypothetical protein DIPPA_58088 [Diplonema papillatum]